MPRSYSKGTRGFKFFYCISNKRYRRVDECCVLMNMCSITRDLWSTMFTSCSDFGATCNVVGGGGVSVVSFYLINSFLVRNLSEKFTLIRLHCFWYISAATAAPDILFCCSKLSCGLTNKICWKLGYLETTTRAKKSARRCTYVALLARRSTPRQWRQIGAHRQAGTWGRGGRL